MAIEKQQKRKQAQLERVKIYFTQYGDAKASREAKSGSMPGEAELKYCQLYLEEFESYVRRFPEKKCDVLPTIFGNILRSFELYSTRVYNADSIHIWPRLLAVVPKDYRELIADARSTVDFFVSVVMLANVVAAVTSARLLWRLTIDFPAQAALRSHMAIYFHLLGSIFFAILIASGCYVVAISAAERWGDYVKGAFDLYLPTLAQSLGVSLPDTVLEQRNYWNRWSTQFRLYTPAGNPPRPVKAGAEQKIDVKDTYQELDEAEDNERIDDS
jgi:hypothetical protein